MKDIAGSFNPTPTTGDCAAPYDLALPKQEAYGSRTDLLISINGSEFKTGSVVSESDARYGNPRHLVINNYAEIFIYSCHIDILSSGNLQRVYDDNLELTIYELRDSLHSEIATKYTLGMSSPVALQNNQTTYKRGYRRERRTVLRKEALPFNKVHLTKLTSEGTEPVTLPEVVMLRENSHNFNSKYRVSCLGPEALHQNTTKGMGHNFMWVGWIVGDRLNMACMDNLESFSVSIPENCYNPILGFSAEGTPWYGYISENNRLFVKCLYGNSEEVTYEIPNMTSAQIAVENGLVVILGGGYA